MSVGQYSGSFASAGFNPIRKFSTSTVLSVSNGLQESRLSLYKDSDGRFRKGLIDLISDQNNLIAAYEDIKSKPGSMTLGVTDETLDGIDKRYFERISRQIREGNFSFTPSRIVKIPKKDKNKYRTLGIGSPRQKIVQRLIHSVLEGIFEPMFLDCSHGFRAARSCHTALSSIYHGSAGH